MGMRRVSNDCSGDPGEILEKEGNAQPARSRFSGLSFDVGRVWDDRVGHPLELPRIRQWRNAMNDSIAFAQAVGHAWDDLPGLVGADWPEFESRMLVWL